MSPSLRLHDPRDADESDRNSIMRNIGRGLRASTRMRTCVSFRAGEREWRGSLLSLSVVSSNLRKWPLTAYRETCTAVSRSSDASLD